MFEKILLPLDGSETAEIAIPYTEELAGRLGSDVALLHASGPEHQQFRHMHQMYINSMADLIQRRIRRRWSRSKVTVKGEILTGQPDDIIYSYVKESDIGLVVMATHGSSGFKAWILGSVTDKVIREAFVPTLVIRAKCAERVKGRKKLINRILMPLGGSEGSRITIPYTEELAVRLKARVSLFRMARSSYSYAGMEGMVYPVGINFTRIDRAEERHAWAYLANVAKGMREKGIPVTYNAVLGTDPAQGILEASKKVKADLLVMSTSGTSPLARWVFGSITERVLRAGELPLLLVRQQAGG